MVDLDKMSEELNHAVQAANERELPALAPALVSSVDGAMLQRIRDQDAELARWHAVGAKMQTELEISEKRCAKLENQRDFFMRAATELRARMADARKVLEDPAPQQEETGA